MTSDVSLACVNGGVALACACVKVEARPDDPQQKQQTDHSQGHRSSQLKPYHPNVWTSPRLPGGSSLPVTDKSCT